MKLKVPKTERRRPQDSRLRRILRRALIIALVVGLMGLAATHLLALITGYDVLAVPEEGVSAVMTPPAERLFRRGGLGGGLPLHPQAPFPHRAGVQPAQDRERTARLRRDARRGDAAQAVGV